MMRHSLDWWANCPPPTLAAASMWARGFRRRGQFGRQRRQEEQRLHFPVDSLLPLPSSVRKPRADSGARCKTPVKIPGADFRQRSHASRLVRTSSRAARRVGRWPCRTGHKSAQPPRARRRSRPGSLLAPRCLGGRRSAAVGTHRQPSLSEPWEPARNRRLASGNCRHCRHRGQYPIHAVAGCPRSSRTWPRCLLQAACGDIIRRTNHCGGSATSGAT
jgi:hypothetical protein